MATIDFDRFFFQNSIFQCIVKDKYQTSISLYYVLAILNSTLIRRYYLLTSQVEGTTKPQLYINILKSLPFIKAENSLQTPVISLVERVLAIKKRDSAADTTTLEGEIDQLVYKLYEFEQLGVEKAIEWTMRRKLGLQQILAEEFVRELHRRMLGSGLDNSEHRIRTLE
jgi:hypothetical protein